MTRIRELRRGSEKNSLQRRHYSTQEMVISSPLGQKKARKESQKEVGECEPRLRSSRPPLGVEGKSREEKWQGKRLSSFGLKKRTRGGGKENRDSAIKRQSLLDRITVVQKLDSRGNSLEFQNGQKGGGGCSRRKKDRLVR